jgi:hypothetical protein
MVIDLLLLAMRIGASASGEPTMDSLLAERGAVLEADGLSLVRRGVRVAVRAISGKLPIEARADVLVPSGLRFLRRRNWATRIIPPPLASLADAPAIASSNEGITRSDALSTLPPLDELAAPWFGLMHAHNVLLGCDGAQVIARIDQEVDTPEILDALLDAVAAVARWDGGLAASLAALPDARPLPMADLAPAVRLADGLVLGVHERARLVATFDLARGAAVAFVERGRVSVDGELPAACATALAHAGNGRLDVLSNGARFAWTTIERDAARHRAAIEALRALAAQGPYR